jgi:shikimate dehydrogenase
VDIIPYLDQMSAEARAVGAVNTVVVVGSKNQYQLQGHNTDVFGFSQSLLKAQSALQNPISNVIIFGNGGSAKAVKYALQNQNIPFHIWHRNRWINEAHETEHPEKYIQANTLFVHTTPLGMWPNTETAIEWPANLIAPTHRLIDLVYNPSETALMKRFANQGAWVMNGAYMLEQQAVAAWMLFSNNNQP